MARYSSTLDGQQKSTDDPRAAPFGACSLVRRAAFSSRSVMSAGVTAPCETGRWVSVCALAVVETKRASATISSLRIEILSVFVLSDPEAGRGRLEPAADAHRRDAQREAGGIIGL